MVPQPTAFGEMMMTAVTGYAHLLFDQQYRLSRQAIEALGYTPGEQYFLDQPVAINAPMQGRALAGSLINSMVIMAQLGVRCRVISCRHYNDQQAETILAEHHLDFALANSQQATGHCNILIDEQGERTMLAAVAAATELGPEQLQRNKDLQLLEGYLANFEPGRALLAHASQYPFALTLSHHALVHSQHTLFYQLYQRHPSYLMGNLQEFQALLGTNDLSATVARLCADGITALISDGPNGAVSVVDGVPHAQPAMAVAVTDTTGAGDALAGVWLAARLLGASSQAALNAALFAAGQVVSQVGPRLTSNHAEHVIALLREERL